VTTPTFRLSSTPTLIAQRLVPGSLQLSFDLQRRSVCTFRLLPVSGTGLEIGQPVRGTVDSDVTDLLEGGEQNDYSGTIKRLLP